MAPLDRAGGTPDHRARMPLGTGANWAKADLDQPSIKPACCIPVTAQYPLIPYDVAYRRANADRHTKGIAVKKLALAIVLATTAAVNAIAADLPVKAPPPAPVPAISWTGIYIGPHVGYAWTDAFYTTNHVSGGPGPCTASVNFNLNCDPVSTNPQGVVAGGQLGGRWQAGAWVFGAEGTWTSYQLSQTIDSVAAGPPGNGLFYNTKLRDIYTATGQVGYSWQSLLAYVKGGYAGGHIEVNSFFSSPAFPAPSNAVPATSTANGWIVGGGLEYSLTSNFSVGVEYNHIHLDGGTLSVCAPPGTNLIFNCSAPFFTTTLKYADIRDNIDQVMFRANYRFNWLAGPVVAKY
jgi:outer membrane immunogenic protein